jgi:hypothetical protein
MHFLGRPIPASDKLPSHLNADVVSDVKRRQEGVRIKHRLGDNTIKMYDKQGSVLRVETTINDATGFKSFRTLARARFLPNSPPHSQSAPIWRPTTGATPDYHPDNHTPSSPARWRQLRSIPTRKGTGHARTPPRPR